MGSFLSGIVTGGNPTLDKDINQSGAASEFSTGVGEGAVTKANKFYGDILSGDPTQEAEALAPEIASAKARTGQQKKTNAEFGNRSGGTAATNAGLDTGVSTDVLNLEGGLKSGAAAGEASLGTTEQQLGLSGEELQAKLAQQKLENQRSSVLGHGISDFADTALQGAEGWLGL
jgi:hypothetical protein